jgi:methylglyoxal synthase
MKETIALIAHNQKKNELLEWVKDNRDKLSAYKLIGTSSTAELINNILELNIEPYWQQKSWKTKFTG